MLQTLRDKTSGWFATVVLGLLIIPFAFVGVEDYMRQTREVPVASISAPPTWWAGAPSFWPFSVFWEHRDVSQQDFRARFEQERQRQRAQLGANFDAREFETVASKRKVLDRMVDERAQELWASRQGIVVSDAMVRKEIADIPAFQNNGKFDLQQYRLALRTLNPPQTEQQFERTVRDSLAQSLGVTAVESTGFAAPNEIARLVGLLGERRDLTVLDVPPPALDAAPVADAEVDAWYRTHSNLYRAPETVTLEYVDIDAAALPVPPVDEAALRQRYEQEKARFVAQEQRQASHILVRVPEGASAAVEKAAREKAASLAAQARAPDADFAALARANSDDTGSKAAGGDLGFVGRGALAPAFEKALFAMQPGQVSDPVRTEFGWHVIQLKQVQAGKQEDFEQARATLEREAAESARDKHFNDVTSRLVDAVLKNPSALAPAAQQVGLPMQTSAPIARGKGEGVLANAALQRAAFSETAISQGMVSDPIEVGPDHSVVFRVAAHSPARQLTLAEVRDRVVAAIHADRTSKAAQKRVDEIVRQVRAGQLMSQVATAQSLPAPKPLAGVPRGAQIAAPGVSEAFFAVRVVRGTPAVGSYVLPDGRALVFTVDAVKPGTVADVGGDTAGIARQLGQVRGYVDAEGMVKVVRRGLTVKINESNL